MTAVVGTTCTELKPVLGQVPLAQLITRIASHGDTLALAEFHNHRTPFRWRGGESYRFVEFLGRLRDLPQARRWCGTDPLALERAYDLTVAKFSNLPRATEQSQVNADADVKYPGPDCRYYFTACMRQIRRKLGEMTTADDIQQEYVAARCLQGLVMRHFMLSCLDCRRRSPGRVSPYFWSVDGVTLCLYMPSAMSTRQRQEWLKAHITDIDPIRPDERHRVQEIIDNLILRREPRSTHHALLERVSAQLARSQDMPEAIVEQLASQGLAKTVAEEKARNIELQRPAIQALGPENLACMIRTIFDDLECGRFQDGHVARAFGLSPASFSRFAGSRWARASRTDGISSIPDLWRNTAQVVAMHPDFTETARETGVWATVQEVLNRDPRAAGSGAHG